MPFLFMGPGELQSDKQEEDGEGLLGSQEPPLSLGASQSPAAALPGAIETFSASALFPQRLKLQR